MVYITYLKKPYQKQVVHQTGGSVAKTPKDKEEELKEKNTVIQRIPQQNLKPSIPEYGKPIPKTNPIMDKASEEKLKKFISFTFK